MPKTGYHHGNLREALVDACLRLLPEAGPRGFTLTEAAREAGVTPAAVYRHFAGRDDLIAEVARQGFDLFSATLGAAQELPASGPIARFSAVGRAYLAFAAEHPGHYIAMFESGLSYAGRPELDRAGRRASDILDRAAAELVALLPGPRRPPARMVAAHVWAMSHGVVELFQRGDSTPAPFAAADLLETGIGVYLRGLGLIEADA